MTTNDKNQTPHQPNHSHAWRGTWNRPMKLDEDSLDSFTIARMTDHNVKGSDEANPQNNSGLAHAVDLNRKSPVKK